MHSLYQNDNILDQSKQFYTTRYEIDGVETDAVIPFLSNETAVLKILVLSHQISKETSTSTVSSLIGIYFLILITFGFVVRLRTTKGYNSLWLSKINNPNKLYSLILGIETYRTTGDIEREKTTCDQFLDTIRSIEQCLKLEMK